MKNSLANKLSKYRFEFRHITVLLIVLITFQVILSFIQKSSLTKFLNKTQEWYQQDSAERIANLSTTTLELLVSNMPNDVEVTEEKKHKIIQSFNIIFSQQLLEPNVEETCLIILKDKKPIIISDGTDFFNFLKHNYAVGTKTKSLKIARNLFVSNLSKLKSSEEIISVLDSNNTFHILVPFIPYGEFVGAYYMKNKPNFEFITNEILMSYNEVAIIYTSLILLGLLAMYYISSYSVRERDEARQLFFEEREQHLKDTLDHDKESMFTKRIYHTHHKAEKVMGFIKEDLRSLNKDNIEKIKNRSTKYANFVSRVIYDMKWYDPPIQTIRNQVFSTNINSIIEFLVNDLFLRLSKSTTIFSFNLNLDNRLPNVPINEFVVWEILEPIIQNSIDHATRDDIVITITTKFITDKKMSQIIIEDNGSGIEESLMQINEDGIKKIFSENVSTKNLSERNSGYGCYIAYTMAVIRCGWKLDVENKPDSGCRFIIEIKN